MNLYSPPAATFIVFPADPEVRRRTYCVLGAPRGGTSMIAKLLQRMGVFMGTGLGHECEDPDFTGHSGIRDIFANPRRRREREGYMESIAEVVDRRTAAHSVWGWKDPLASFYLAELLPWLRNPHVIWVTRDPGAVAQREMAEEPDRPRSHILAHFRNATNAYAEMARIIDAACCPTLLVSYERAIGNPRSTAREIVEFAGRHDPDVVEWAAHSMYAPG